MCILTTHDQHVPPTNQIFIQKRQFLPHFPPRSWHLWVSCWFHVQSLPHFRPPWVCPRRNCSCILVSFLPVTWQTYDEASLAHFLISPQCKIRKPFFGVLPPPPKKNIKKNLKKVFENGTTVDIVQAVTGIIPDIQFWKCIAPRLQWMWNVIRSTVSIGEKFQESDPSDDLSYLYGVWVLRSYAQLQALHLRRKSAVTNPTVTNPNPLSILGWTLVPKQGLGWWVW